MTAFSNITLRSASEEGCTTKGAQLISSDMDTSFKEIVQFLKKINNPTSISNYAAGTVYDATKPNLRFARSKGADNVLKIWEFINATPTAGQTPASSPLYWTEVTAGGLLSYLFDEQTYVQAVEISAAEMQDLNSNRVTCIDGQAGKVIVPMFALGYNDVGVIPFATAGEKLLVKISTTTVFEFTQVFVESVADYLELAYPVANNLKLFTDQDLIITSVSDWLTSPAGDGTVYVVLIYKILSL